MGNRAFVVFEDRDSETFSPAIYLHWNGGPESVYAFLDELERRGVRGDQCYEAARFVQIVGEFMDQDAYSGLSLGISNGPKNGTIEEFENFNHGDNGLYIVCRHGGRRVRRFTGYDEFHEWTQAQVESERKAAYKHEYHTKQNIANTWQEIYKNKPVA